MITDFELIEGAIYLFDEDGTAIYAGDENDFQEWIEKKNDMSYFEYKTHSDNGEGETSPAKAVNWIAAKEFFYNLECFEKYYNSVIN